MLSTLALYLCMSYESSYNVKELTNILQLKFVYHVRSNRSETCTEGKEKYAGLKHNFAKYRSICFEYTDLDLAILVS